MVHVGGWGWAGNEGELMKVPLMEDASRGKETNRDGAVPRAGNSRKP